MWKIAYHRRDRRPQQRTVTYVTEFTDRDRQEEKTITDRDRQEEKTVTDRDRQEEKTITDRTITPIFMLPNVKSIVSKIEADVESDKIQIEMFS